MGDIFVHIRMKACCRMALADIDKEKNKAKGSSGIMGIASLATMLGEKTIDAAKVAIPAGGAMSTGGNAEMERVTRALCAKLCDTHAQEHEGKGETEEAGFWRDLGASFEGKVLPSASQSTPKVGGQQVADMASKLRKEYRQKGVTYSQDAPFYPASNHADCSHYVNSVLQASGVDVPYVTTKQIGAKEFEKYYEKVTDSPQPGDIVWQPGHMGIYVGQDDQGRPLGEQMGESGANQGVWGPGGWFSGGDKIEYYRPKK